MWLAQLRYGCKIQLHIEDDWKGGNIDIHEVEGKDKRAIAFIIFFWGC